MAKLNLKDFIELTGKTSITDWAKYNWLGVSYGPGPGPEPLPDPLIIDFLNYAVGIDDESGNPVYPLPYNFGPYVTATGDGSVPGAQIRNQNNTFEGKIYDRGLRLYGTGRTFTLHVPEGYKSIEVVVESTSTRTMEFDGVGVVTFVKTPAGIAQKSSAIDITSFGPDIAVKMTGSITLLEIRLSKEVPEPEKEISRIYSSPKGYPMVGQSVKDAAILHVYYTDGTNEEVTDYTVQPEIVQENHNSYFFLYKNKTWTGILTGYDVIEDIQVHQYETNVPVDTPVYELYPSYYDISVKFAHQDDYVTLSPTYPHTGESGQVFINPDTDIQEGINRYTVGFSWPRSDGQASRSYNRGIEFTGVQPVNPLSRDFTTQEVFDEFDTAYKEDRYQTNPYVEDTVYRRPQEMTYDLTDQGLYMIAPSTIGRAGVIKSMNLATTGKYRVDVDIKSWVNEGHGTLTQRQNILSIFCSNNDNTDYFAPLLMYEPNGTYSLDLQYRDASNNKVTHKSILTNIDEDFIKYSTIIDLDNRTIEMYLNDTLIETWSDNPKMESFGSIGIAATNNTTLKTYNPVVLKSITVTEVE